MSSPLVTSRWEENSPVLPASLHGTLDEQPEGSLVVPLSLQSSEMRYEQLLIIQQRQHALALEQKDSELAHLKACLDVLEGRGRAPEESVAQALQTKDEECALMMAAKHKELELMVGLLQMREQQIEELRVRCEEQQFQLDQVRHLWSSSNSLRPTPGSTSPPLRQENVSSPCSKEENSQMRKEIRRLRLRMEDLESQVHEHHDRCSALSEELQVKTEQEKALKEHIRFLSAKFDSDGRPVAARLFQEEASALDFEGSFLRSEGGSLFGPVGTASSRPGDGNACNGPIHSQLLSPGRSQLSSPRLGRGHERHAEPCFAGSFGQPVDEGGHSSVPSGTPSQVHTYRSGVQADKAEMAHQQNGVFPVPHQRADFVWPLPSEPSPRQDVPEEAMASRQSQELLREMKRLRQQMSDLEHMASGHQQPERPSLGAMEPVTGGATASSQPADRLGASANSLGTSAPVHAVDRLGASTNSLGSLSSQYGSGGLLGEEPRPARHRPEGLQADGPGMPPVPPTRAAPAATDTAFGRSEPVSPDLAGWEYRPHACDPIDEAVASLVNRPGGRYRGWRALLCRLDQGVYLCGTRRILLRASEAMDQLEASSDGGATWADLADVMSGTAPRALLERAKGSVM